ncbi:transcriptional regulator [Richelia sinica FACHB-800]|uniref:Transcriptional regulator n=1 Tax=Richelia sinica FACHB-800 TaxID=1357546 RepID=A0A975Y668_9NOST|nr:helix-turn-helix domain-containing protein [Richelia sinica]MBD2664067.1 helix-turn-helix transcriptional regulator [Richelia sinica FACHB-800]QXE24975.1 transcriptional regulator [Richelia sinica FACHB-800]
MGQEKRLTVDCVHEHSCADIVPRSPLLSSYNASWHGVNLEYHRQPSHETPEHFFQQHIVVISLDAKNTKAERILNGKLQTESIYSGDVIIIPAKTDHLSRWDKEGEFLLLSIEPAFFQRTAFESGDFHNIHLLPHFATPDHLIQQIGLSLKSELEFDGKGTRIYVQSLTNALCMHLIRHYSTFSANTTNTSQGKGLSQRKLQKAISYIQENLQTDLSLPDISAFVDMSMYHFSRLFKQSTGFAPHQYVLNCRIEEGKRLLTHTEKTIDEISRLVGFQNQSHFTSVFRKFVGTTPKVYREQVKI